MSAEKDPSFLGFVLAAVAAGISGLGAWAWNNTMGRITALEQGKVDKEDFKQYVERSEKSRDELRDSQKLIFQKVDGLRDHVDEKFDRLADLIRSK